MFQEVINILLDWMRLYLVFGLAHRNPVSLILCFFIFYGLLYVEVRVVINQPVLALKGGTLKKDLEHVKVHVPGHFQAHRHVNVGLLDACMHACMMHGGVSSGT